MSRTNGNDASRNGAPHLSIVVPFYNEEASATMVLDEVRACQPTAEVLAVDDGSTDKTWDAIRSMSGVRGLRFNRNQGQSAAILAGLRHARGRLCALMDGDGQNDPRDIAGLIEMLEESGADVVCGYRVKRRDTWSRRLASRIANRVRRWLIRDGARDTGCSLKVFRREAVDCLIPFDGQHRFMPAFFQQAGWRVVEAPVHHRPRERGLSKYNNRGRALRGIHDLIGVRWYLKRRVDPARIDETTS